MFKIISANISSSNAFVNKVSKNVREPLVWVEKSQATGEMKKYEYQSLSKVRHFFSNIFGEKVQCLTDNGFLRVAKLDRRGNKVLETKSYPNSQRYAITRFKTKDGVTRPLERSVYEPFSQGEKPEMVNYKRYENGYEFYRFNLNKDSSYKRVQELADGSSHVEIGFIKPDDSIEAEKYIEPSKNARKVKTPITRYTDGAILKVKAKDIATFVEGVQTQFAQNTNKCARKLRNPNLRNTNNIGAIFTENPYYDSFRKQVTERPRTHWAAQNLEQWGFHYPYPKGENPDDVFDVYIPRSERAANSFVMHRYRELLCNGIASQDVKDFYSNIVLSRLGISDLFDSPVHPKKDYDFRKEAEYLYNASLDAQYTDFVRQRASELKLKPLEYKPKVKAQ